LNDPGNVFLYNRRLGITDSWGWLEYGETVFQTRTVFGFMKVQSAALLKKNVFAS